jgi:ketosteroid isomerase-like protein
MNDHAEIGAALVRYATAVDTKDWPMLRTVFHDDCVMEVGDQRHEGIDALTEHMAQLHAPLTATVHRLTNTAVEIDGDRATASTYLDALLLRPDHPSGPTLQIVGIYEDTLRRDAAGWRIQHRRFRRVWHDGSTAMLAR